MSAQGTVDAVYADYVELVASVGKEDASALAALNRTFPKHILLAAASRLEYSIKSIILQHAQRSAGEPLAGFIEQNILKRGYHTLFDWKSNSAKRFFRGFGNDCLEAFEDALEDDDVFRRQVHSFMLLGRERNVVVHNDYAAKTVDYTPEELLEKFREAELFVGRIETLIEGKPLSEDRQNV